LSLFTTFFFLFLITLTVTALTTHINAAEIINHHIAVDDERYCQQSTTTTAQQQPQQGQPQIDDEPQLSAEERRLFRAYLTSLQPAHRNPTAK
jgi:hypothetical protein